MIQFGATKVTEAKDSNNRKPLGEKIRLLVTPHPMFYVKFSF